MPRKPEWPVYQPENLPSAWKKIAEITDVRFKDTVRDWQLYFDGAMLIIYYWNDGISPFSGEPYRYVEQYEFPIGAAAWFVENLSRFFNAGDPSKPQTSEGFHHYGHCGDEELGISRLINSIGRDIPGYSLDNCSRCDHPDMDLCQSFEMSDDFLFDQGMLELFKDIAKRHAAGNL
ncbi:hypothetical protein SNR37_003050 [Agarivorans aestuarii]|uniref:DUF4375 domain-containing protein n=1 Tax=Agarivorans aestuarii TaxID=1563703 RepID=A0ABU7G3N9_9ALTE|nr:hypothetical protein [Agarivorans aestuarii]MEE1673624.1 hypothetical protein [Agarivorans aestuarii]